MKKLITVIATIVSFSANAQMMKFLNCPDQSCIWYITPKDTITIDVEITGLADSYNFRPNIRCDGKSDTLNVGVIKRAGNKLKVAPPFENICRQYGKRYTYSMGGYSERDITVVFVQPLGIEDEYYANNSNIVHREYFTTEGYKIESPEQYSGLLIVKQTFSNGNIKTVKQCRL